MLHGVGAHAPKGKKKKNQVATMDDTRAAKLMNARVMTA
jgi:hypothetical protein